MLRELPWELAEINVPSKIKPLWYIVEEVYRDWIRDIFLNPSISDKVVAWKSKFLRKATGS